MTDVQFPTPAGWRILIEPVKVKEKSEGGIVLVQDTKNAQEYLRYIGKVVAMGPLCYKHAKFEGGDPWCKVGDWVAYGQYAGQEVVIKGEDGIDKLRLINDDEVLATVPDPENILIYV